MGENNEAKAENNAAGKGTKKKAEGGEELNLNNHNHATKEKRKSRWTVEACKKAARRFDSREAWAQGAPSSYKSAVAHGWEAECLKVLRKPDLSTKTPGMQPQKGTGVAATRTTKPTTTKKSA